MGSLENSHKLFSMLILIKKDPQGRCLVVLSVKCLSTV